jgi:hypothetical protein
MKEKILMLTLFIMMVGNSYGQLIQGTIKSGTAADEIEVWLRPDFSNATQYIYQIGLPIAFPSNVTPQPTSLIVTLDPTFIANFGNNYSVSVYPRASNTGNTENYFSISLIRGGAGASNAQTWTSGVEFKVLTAKFVGGSDVGVQVKLADYQDAGSDGQGNFYTVDGNATYYVSATSSANFYTSAGQSTAGGSASAGFSQTVALISLPVNLISFSGHKAGSKNRLQWTTVNELNNSGFEIQRSLDGIKYLPIAFVPTQTANGNGTISLNYLYEDNNPIGKKQFYRLKQVDLDNKGRLSQIVMITGDRPLSLGIGGLYPNPSIKKLNAIINSPKTDVAELAMIDLSGKILSRRIENIGPGSNSVILDVADLPTGTYLLQVKTQGENNVVTSQFIKQ